MSSISTLVETVSLFFSTRYTRLSLGNCQFLPSCLTSTKNTDACYLTQFTQFWRDKLMFSCIHGKCLWALRHIPSLYERKNGSDRIKSSKREAQKKRVKSDFSRESTWLLFSHSPFNNCALHSPLEYREEDSLLLISQTFILHRPLPKKLSL